MLQIVAFYRVKIGRCQPKFWMPWPHLDPSYKRHRFRPVEENRALVQCDCSRDELDASLPAAVVSHRVTAVVSIAELADGNGAVSRTCSTGR